MKHCAVLVLTAAFAVGGCRSGVMSGGTIDTGDDCDTIASRLDRGDWMVNQETRLWKILINQSLQAMPPKHVGYLEEKRYTRLEGGPEFKMYSVTSLHRDEQLGHIDSVGRAVRYEPRRNRNFVEVDVGTGTLEESVGAIFDTVERVTLEPTSARRMAFESLDADGSGVLELQEVRRYGDRITGADTNGDGLVDFEEFAAIRTL